MLLLFLMDSQIDEHSKISQHFFIKQSTTLFNKSVNKMKRIDQQICAEHVFANHNYTRM